MAVDIETIGVAFETSGLVKGQTALKQTEQAANRTADAADKTERSFSALDSAARTFAATMSALAAGAAIVSIGKSLYEASAQAQRLRTMLDFATGGKGSSELRYLSEVTSRLGLEFKTTAAAYGQFQAAARGTALEGQKARAVFESVAKASAVMGLSADQTSGVLLALQQMVSKGTVQAEELRGQLGERLPGAFQIAARAMGVTTAELGKMLEQGQVVADDFLPKFADALNASLGDAAEKAANRLDAAVNKFNNAWERLKRNAGDSGLSQSMSDGLGLVSAAMEFLSDDLEKINSQGDLRKIAADVIELNNRATVLRNGLEIGFYGPQFRAELDEVNAKLEVAKQRFRELDQQLGRGAGAGGGRGDGMAQLRDFQQRAEAAAKAEASAAAVRSQWMSKYATQAEKLAAELEKARVAHKGVIPPDLEARIRASFIKPVRESAKAVKDASADMSAHVEELIAYRAALAEVGRIYAANQAIHGREIEQRERSIESLIQGNEALREEIAMIGMEESARIDRLRVREDEAIAMLEEQAYMLSLQEGTEVLVDAIRQEIRLRRERAALLGQKSEGTATQEAEREYKKYADEAQRLNDQIGQSLADALMEGGKSAWEYIKGLFRSQVLAPIIKAVIAPVTGGLATLATGGASAASGGSALSGLSSLTGLTSLGTFGGGLSAGFGGLMGSLGLSATGTTLGGALSAGWTAMGAGNIAGGLGTLAGALGPIALGIGALVSLFGNKNKWSGQFGETQVRGGRAGEVDTRSTFTNSSYSADISRTTAQVGETIAQTIAAFGGATQDFILRQFSATASKKDRAQAGTDLYIGGEFISIGNTEVKKDQQGAAFAEQVQRATLVALQRTVGGAVGEYFDSIDALTASIEDVQKVLATAESVRAFGEQAKWLGGVLDDLAGLGVQATADMAKAAGGFDQLLSITSSAYQVLYTEEERLAFLREDVAAGFANLGLAMPETTQQLRTYIEGLDTSTEAGRSLLVELLKLAPALDQVAEKVADVAGAVLTEAQQQAVRAGYSINPEVAAVQAQQSADDAIREAVRIQREREKEWEAWLGIKDPGRKMPASEGMGMAVNLAGAYQSQIDALTAQRSEIEKSVDAYRRLNDSLLAFKTSLVLGASSTLTPQQQYELAKAQFDSVSAQAMAGDVAAQEQLRDVVSAFVEESRSYFGANDAYAADFERSTGVIDQIVQQRQSAEDRQVALLEAVEQRLAEIEKRLGQSLNVQEAGFTESVKATRSVADAQSAATLRARSENA